MSVLQGGIFSRPKNAVAAGTSSQNGTAVDMSSGGSILFVALLGTLTSTQVTSLKAQQGDASDGSDAADITGATTSAAADGDSNKLLVLEVKSSLITKKYVRPVLVRGTANAVLDGIIAIKLENKKVPTTQSSDVSQSTLAH